MRLREMGGIRLPVEPGGKAQLTRRVRPAQ
jgi:hypothetical protein